NDVVLDTIRLVQTTRKLLVSTTAIDWTSGNFSMIDGDNFSASNNLSPIHSDNVAGAYGQAGYILERLGADNIIRIEADGQMAYQQNIGAGVNVQDIACANQTSAFLTLFQSDQLLVFNPEQGEVTDSIDLSGYVSYAHTDSAEQYPFTGPAHVYQSKLLVACQRLKSVPSDWGTSYVPGDTSLILVIDVVSHEVITSIPLLKKNPVSLDMFHNTLYVGCAGDPYDPTDGGIEKISLSNLEHEGVVVEESLFDGNISSLVAVSDSKLFVSVGKNIGNTYWTDIVSCDPSEGSVSAPIENIDNAFGGIAYDGIHVYVGDRSEESPGVVVIDPKDGSVVEGPIDTGLPPMSIGVIVIDQENE
ncbi:MAG: hypothetical protein ACOCW2_03635, partial [Chitinivibrionales bacterium]